MSPEILLGVIVVFFVGAIPFSVWIGRIFLGRDIRQYGDGNPGGSNVIRAGSLFWGVAALLLDFLKGAVPVGWACLSIGVTEWALVPLAVAPVFGHAFSPFLRFRGGKAVAVTFGIWAGLTLWAGPVLLGLSLGLLFVLVTIEAWVVMGAMSVLLAYLLVSKSAFALLVIWLANALVLAWKHRADLGQPPALRPAIKRVLPL